MPSSSISLRQGERYGGKYGLSKVSSKEARLDPVAPSSMT